VVGGEPTIGRPLPGTLTLVLDAGLDPVPVGGVGELCLGGAGLARGYGGRPALTAERFVPHPFSDQPGARVYRTGDRARLLPDGRLGYLGRLDRQVKLRGHRIELGEIGATLARHPAVRDAVATVIGTGSEAMRIVGYAVPDAPDDPSPRALRSFLEGELPGAMVPAEIVLLGELPLTRNGKVDLRALPLPWKGRLREGSTSAPSGPAEEVLVGIWQEILGLDRIGVDEDFFELGGHSLLAARVMARVREAFQVDVELREVFSRPTVAGLAAALEDAWGDPEIVEEIARTYLEIADLTDEDAEELLAHE